MVFYFKSPFNKSHNTLNIKQKSKTKAMDCVFNRFENKKSFLRDVHKKHQILCSDVLQILPIDYYSHNCYVCSLL